MRPLDFLGRIKVKLGIVIVLAVATAFVVNEVGINSGLSREVRIGVAVALALIMVQLLAMGMTRPLREMARAAQTIAKGRYSLRVQATSRDEVGELARAFNAMAADLGEVDRQRRELVANVSHELRTPITGLRAVLENVVDGVSAPDPVTMRTALAQTERLGRLVAQLLDLSRLDSGARLIEPEAVELRPLVEQAVLEAALAREDVRLATSVPAGLVVLADPDLLAQVLANLLDNAVRHSPPDGTVTVTASSSGAGVCLSVADRGPGIPAPARARVFERFSRLDAGRTADGGGAGLGLAIVKEIVELHGGSIRIDDCAGCRMLVDLPGRTAMAPEEARPPRSQDPAPSPITASASTSTDPATANPELAGAVPAGAALAGAEPADPEPADAEPAGAVSARAVPASSGGIDALRVDSTLTTAGRAEASDADPAPPTRAGSEYVGSGRSDASHAGSGLAYASGSVGESSGGVDALAVEAGQEGSASSGRPDPAGAGSALGDSGWSDASRAGSDLAHAPGSAGAMAASSGGVDVPAVDAGQEDSVLPSSGGSDSARAGSALGDSGRVSASRAGSGLAHALSGRAGSVPVGGDASRAGSALAGAGGDPLGVGSAAAARVRAGRGDVVGVGGDPGLSSAGRGGSGVVGGVPPVPGDDSPIKGLVKIVAGGIVGLAVGFVAGLLAAAFASVIFGDSAAVVTLVCVTALFGAIGASLGASAARRAAEHAHLVATYGPVAQAYGSAGPGGEAGLGGRAQAGASGQTYAAAGAGVQGYGPVSSSGQVPPGGPGSAGQHDPGSAGQLGPRPGGQLGSGSAGQHGSGSAGQHDPGAAGQHGSGSAGQLGSRSAGQHGSGSAGQLGSRSAGQLGSGSAGQHGSGSAGQHGARSVGQYGAASVGQHGSGSAGQYGLGAGNAYGPPPVYTPPPLFPRPELPETPRWLLPTAGGAGVFAAIALPDAQIGLGIVLVCVVLGAAALPAVVRRMTPWTIAFGLTSYWLIAMAAVRDADWLVTILLLAGAGLAALAVSGAGLGWLGVIRGGASILLAFGPLPWFLAAPLKGLAARRRILPTLTGLGITAVLLVVFGLLFSSADPVFASYVERLTTTPDWAESLPARIVLFAVFAALLAAVVLVALRPVADPVGPDIKMPVSRSIWLVPLTAVNLLFAAFVAVQITALFGGDAWVLKTAGLTYAEYARQGFFQLVVVSLAVLGIVAVAAGVIKTERRERWVLAGQLGVLCGLTMVVLFSALHRMDLYTDAYGLSRLRLSVEATVYWLGALFALVLLAGAGRLAGRGSGWLPRTIVLVTGLALGAFAVVNPDLRVAESQVAVRGVQKLDSDYLGDLGAEAVPALDRLPEPLRSCVLADVVAANGLDRPDSWNGWNLDRTAARALLAERPIIGKDLSDPTLTRSDGSCFVQAPGG
ncbi:DUF4153 domain-containing protein [Nonomuraea ferruginea]|uniref:Signal transduction histidine-protein kinase/phosphatase MprB n=1 Tax=Nonomuraea ferruginea TaxID=46174 RepID=A0ABT4TBK5_9ACTN|nr:DUF4153 domain-containing protein [Nonomuraea ferruginea]MDA0646877.1 DUF4173 domain-containing protein [Nonomuraea ferruginea]